MEVRLTALEKAFDLARSGKCLNLSELLLHLKRDRYDASQVEGPALRKQLIDIIEVARRPP
jgi:hypothetical protein